MRVLCQVLFAHTSFSMWWEFSGSFCPSRKISSGHINLYWRKRIIKMFSNVNENQSVFTHMKANCKDKYRLNMKDNFLVFN